MLSGVSLEDVAIHQLFLHWYGIYFVLWPSNGSKLNHSYIVSDLGVEIDARITNGIRKQLKAEFPRRSVGLRPITLLRHVGQYQLETL